MTTQTTVFVVSKPDTASIAAVFVTGLALLFTSGYVQATSMHDAAHDQRHAMAFPCQ